MKKIRKHIPYDYLVQQYQGGDMEAIKMLIRQFDGKLRKQILRQTCDKASLDDVAQESWYAIIRGLGSVNFRISFDVWALSIARRKGIDWIRIQQKNRDRFRLYSEENVHDISSKLNEFETSTDQVHLLRQSIQQLPQTQRIVLTMFYLENLRIDEISEILEVSKGTVKSRLFYAREVLKNKIKSKTIDR